MLFFDSVSLFYILIHSAEPDSSKVTSHTVFRVLN